MTHPLLPLDNLTVVIRNEGPFIHLQEPPTKRTVRIILTLEQRRALELRCTGSDGGKPIYETISDCFFEA